MSLATRCYTCGTVFRVVQDQLKVSEGWVRCGRCNEVFNALEALFDLERDTPPEWTPREAPAAAAPSAAAPAAHLASPAVDVNVGHDGGVDVDVGDRADEEFAQPIYRRETDSTPAMRVDERDRLDFPDARFASESEPAPGEAGDNKDGVSILLPLGEDAVVPDVEFVRHAQRRARWESPLARIGLSLVGTLFAVGLLLQAAHHFRDGLAARWPDVKPALLAWCDLAGCTIQAPRHIEEIAVDSTALTRGDNADTFRLAVTLRNRAGTALAIPAVDLSLTDPSGLLVARRMLTPSDFRVGTTTIGPGAELPLQLVLSTGSARVTGYTVEIFYP